MRNGYPSSRQINCFLAPHGDYPAPSRRWYPQKAITVAIVLHCDPDPRGISYPELVIVAAGATRNVNRICESRNLKRNTLFIESLPSGTRPPNRKSSIAASSKSQGPAPSETRIRILTFEPAGTGAVAWLQVAFVHTSPIGARADQVELPFAESSNAKISPESTRPPYPAGRETFRRKSPRPPRPSTSVIRSTLLTYH